MGYVDAIKTMDGISPLLPQRFGNAFATYFVQRTVLDRILSCIRLSLLFFSVFLFLFFILNSFFSYQSLRGRANEIMMEPLRYVIGLLPFRLFFSLSIIISF